jgi:DNA-binding NarL/FixJ family response regulator
MKNPGKAKGRGKRKRRVLIVDDHAVLREGLAMVINQQPDLIVCGEAEDAPAALKLVRAAEPDVAIVDLSLMSDSGLELIKDIKAQRPGFPMLVLSLHDETLYAERALRAGARGYIMKRASTAEVVAALRKVLSGDIYLSEKMVSLTATWKTETRQSNQTCAGGSAQPAI